MNAHLYYLVIGALLFLCLVFITRRFTNDSGEDARLDHDALSTDLCSRIFSAEDSNFVSSASRISVARTFRRERKLLAIHWLQGERASVSQLFQSYVSLSRQNPEVTFASEVRLGIYLLTFRMATGILFVFLSSVGPLRAARLVSLLLAFSNKLQKMGEALSPGQVTRIHAEIVGPEPHTDR